MNIAQRFDAKWTPEPNTGCFLWTAARDRDGYGVFWDGEFNRKAHRYAYSIAFGTIPDGALVCHRCDTPECVNPEHLWVGTHADNLKDRDQKGRTASGDINGARAQPETRPRGWRHPASKLTDGQVKEIRRRCADGESQTAVARDFGVRSTNVNAIVLRKAWRHLS